MERNDYLLFSPTTVAGLDLKNRLVRSSTWDPSIFGSRKITDEVLDLYRNLALGGVGLIITGGLPVIEDEPQGDGYRHYGDLSIEGFERLVEVIRSADSTCRVVVQVEAGHLDAVPSDVPSPFSGYRPRVLTVSEIKDMVNCFVEAVVDMHSRGFDGVQLHASHGGLLSRFLSPHTNRRDDEYGGSVANRARVVREIVAGARESVGDWPILIKANGTDYLEEGLDVDTFPQLARELEGAGIDAIEVSGGMWDCLARPEEELGFRRVPAPESHTRIHKPEQQSYFLKYAEALDPAIPVILVGGNRDVERLEEILQSGAVDLVALCRPLINEPGLPNRWLEGRGISGTECISCNSCIHDMIMHPGRDAPGLVTCVMKNDKEQHREAQRWLATWVEENIGS